MRLTMRCSELLRASQPVLPPADLPCLLSAQAAPPSAVAELAVVRRRYALTGMNVIESKWKERQSRIEEGIFLGTDEFIALQGSPSCGYSAAPRSSITPLLQAKPDYWCDLIEFTDCEACHGDLSIFGGGTSWEAEGFIAVEQRSQLLWLLHLSESEEFIQLSTDGTSITARSGGYPNCFEWRILIAVPESLSISRVP